MFIFDKNIALNKSRPFPWLPFLKIMTLIISMVSGMAAIGASVPNFDRPVSVKAVDQSIEMFLQELFGQINVPVVIDSKVHGNISGTFDDKTAMQVFDEISGSFGITEYFDGAVVHVYSANDISQKIVPMPSRVAMHVLNNAKELGMLDKKNNLQSASNGGLVISGTKRFIEQVEELIAATKNTIKDTKSPLSFRVFYLKYAWAQDVTFNFGGRQVLIPGVANILSFLVEDNVDGRFAKNFYTTVNDNSLDGLRGHGLSADSNYRDGNSPFPQDEINLNSNSPGFSGETSDVRIGVDPRLNAVIVRDSPERMKYYEALISSLDVKPKMVEVEATIIDIHTGRLRELGINWRAIKEDGDAEILFGRGNASDLRLQPNQTITPSGEGGFISFVLGDTNQFIGRINALEKQGAAKIVSSPHILTLSNVEAIFNTSSTFYVRVAGEEEVDLFNVSVGTSLRVTPHVFEDEGSDKLKLLVAIEDGQQDSQTVDDIPVVSRSVINTQALLNINESVLIGGIVREATLKDNSKVPLLGDIPVLGNLFKFKSEETERVERLFLISPRLKVRSVDQSQSLDKINAVNQSPDLDFYFNVETRKDPKYPQRAAKRGIEGFCIVDYRVKRSGKTDDVSIDHCSNEIFASASVRAVKKFKYSAKFDHEDMIDIANIKAKIVFELEQS